MKITQLATYAVPPRWLFLKIENRRRDCGLGRARYRRPGRHGRDHEELSDYVIGCDPRDIEDSACPAPPRGPKTPMIKPITKALAGVDASTQHPIGSQRSAHRCASACLRPLMILSLGRGAAGRSGKT
jgi:L-alanine-DL-glutamate epimerase-like enolase superfamily enzyme